ncbi:hypothetical protein NQ314_001283 [Rhamnusium bicolor]|uniref:Ras-associating domain-containing protein n=1 Tax=Rhamnusium bicolor TaxID=1586634 RepID=A0AAV8ZSN8_9CUCU|nr:hypothetical protein NQ314_001283 [Rhamnusium bicolor]
MMWLNDSKAHILDDSDVDSASSGEEIPIWVRGEQRWVSGISEETTCQDIINVLLHDEEMRGRHISTSEQYQITERWRGVEQPLDEFAKILDIWNAWGTAQTEMALRQRNIEGVSNQENINSRLIGKSALAQPTKGLLPKRAALGEVGNKLSALNNNVTKKVGVMGPPQVLPKKTLNNTVLKKENISKIQEKTSTNSNKPPLKRQESVLKNIEDEKVTEIPKSYSSKQLSIIDPDEGSKNEPQMVTEYLADIFNYLRDLESKYPIRDNFLEGHQSTPRMRAILVNWLVEVHINFKLYLETLHLCIAIVDRYLQDNKNIGRDTLQLVGTSAMIIASKYEEMYLPDLEDFVYICDDTFSKKQILRMEIDILKKLDFNLGRPLSLHFLRRYNKIAQVRSDHHVLGKYILELALLDYDLCYVKPSIQAAAACCLSIGILNEVMDLTKVWTPTLVRYTTYDYSDFRSVIFDLAHLIVKSETSKYQTIRKKYTSASYSKISLNSKLYGPLIRKLTTTPLIKKYT